MTINNGFWIGWLDLLALLLQLQSTETAHNLCLSKTRSIPYWTRSAFSSAVTDLLLIYQSVTCSASVVRWLTLHCWTLNSLTTEPRPTRSSLHCSLCRLPVTMENFCCVSVVMETHLVLNCSVAIYFVATCVNSACIRSSGNVPSEPLRSSGILVTIFMRGGKREMK
jgi:hypothetical protein